MAEKRTQRRSSEDDVSADRSNESPIWLTVYSDMVTNLMLFFLMLFAITRLHAVARENVLNAFKDKFTGKEIVKKTNVNIQNAELEKIVFIENTDKYIKITLPSPVLFGSGKADLKNAAHPVLNEIAKMIKENEYPIVVEGHTDNDPISGEGVYPTNWHLSSARAFSVLRYFIHTHSISPTRLSALGYGEYQPVVENTTPENKAKNRRIEITMVKK